MAVTTASAVRSSSGYYSSTATAVGYKRCAKEAELKLQRQEFCAIAYAFSETYSLGKAATLFTTRYAIPGTVHSSACV